MSPTPLAPSDAFEYEFYLYVSGATPNSTRAVRNMKDICEEFLAGRYQLRIIDMYQQPELAQQEQIVAAPTLVRSRPLPRRRLMGDLSNRAAVLAILGIDHLPSLPNP